MIQASGPTRGPYFSPIEEVVQQPWTRGRVVLVGDAAHAMSPNMAEGVGMAVEDGLVLAETIAAGLPLAEFEARRRPRVENVSAQTHRRDRARNLPSFARNPMLTTARPADLPGQLPSACCPPPEPTQSGGSAASTSALWRWPTVSYPTTVTHGVSASTSSVTASETPAADSTSAAATTTAGGR